ncbi:MAG TPA: glycosyltransferase family A protein [Coleofasciculaceae cyanobacterium]
MEPLVSIGMGVWNCEKTLKPALQSIVNQTYQNWELLLIDDGSSDRTVEIARSFHDPRIQIIVDGLHKNLATRLNQAVALGRGKYFARMDGDDIAYPKRLEIQVQYLEEHLDVDLVGSGIIIFGKAGQPFGINCSITSHAEICRSPRSGLYLTHPTWIGKMDWFRQNPYRTYTIRMEDQDLLLHTYQTSHFACIPEALLGYRNEALSLKKILIGRYDFSIALIEKAVVEKQYLFLVGVLEQAIKSLIDIFAVVTGLEKVILRHRFGKKIDTTHLIEWQQVWSTCNESGG